MRVIECSGLAKRYRVGFARAKQVQALAGIDLHVEQGEVFGLIGPNGAGKSTAIKILLNLVLPSAGEARLFGIDVRRPEARQGVGYVPEAPVPYEHLTGREYLCLQADLAGVPRAEVAGEVEGKLARVEMTAHAKLPIRRYSKGMTQRVMLAGALLGQPRLVILDEPTSGLDPIGRRLVRELILELRRAGTTVLFCTHIISDVESLCDRVALLAGGQVRRTGTIAELVKAGAKTHEITLGGAHEAAVRELLGELVLHARASAAGTLVSVNDASLQVALQRLTAAAVPVLRVEPERFSLENLFVEALKNSDVPGGSLQ